MPTDIEHAISQQVREAKQRELDYDCDVRQETRLDLIHRYLHLTRTIMPALAQTRSNIFWLRKQPVFAGTGSLGVRLTLGTEDLMALRHHDI